ncbi:hypothetical protein J4861_11295 [Prevotella melaninogenica]|uniref:hypothetical protein n=1 Tax=Prevotella melaninogenica TaxID=28132 RepID=UPI001BAA69AB|nr:hypothetical protein [Prevotella melaninogenica]QUB61372.1 hypothetical protein J4861_11295 [Prevotella melaninogenica]
MRKKQEKKDYSAPRCMIIQVNETTNLMVGSPFNGQHNPATPGGTISSAKQAPAWQEVGDKNEGEFSAWED